MLEYVTDAETSVKGLPFTVQYTYNGLGQKVKEAYPGATYTYTYNGSGNVLNTRVDGITKSTATYDLLGRALSSTDGVGNTTTQQWNAFSKISQSNTPGDVTISGNQTNYQYDFLGNLVYAKDSVGAVTTYTYDSFSRNLSKSVSDVSGVKKITTKTEYDLNGNVLTQTDGNSKITKATYDRLNRQATTTNALGQITTNTYDANGNLKVQKNYLGNTTTNVYDGINRLVEIVDAYNNIVQQILYNDANAQTSSYDALHNRTQFIYDKNMRQSGTIDAEGNTSTSTYDTRGNISSKVDGKGNITAYLYDGENRLVNVTDALGNSTNYSYDAAGNLLSQTDGNGNTTTYQYNSANLRIAKIDPSGSSDSSKSERYTYYPNGLMATKIDRKGTVTTYTYDIFGRLITEDAGGEVQSYTYDFNGNTLTMTDATGTTFRTFDALNRNATKTVPVIGKSIYDYDLPTGVLGEYSQRTTDPKGNITLKTYDKIGRLSKVTVGGNTTTYDYYRSGRRYRITYPDKTKETFVYNKNNQVTNLINAKADNSVISSFQYTYDTAGNQLTKTEGKGTTTYVYDSLNRLSSVTEPNGRVTSYTYDGAGNRRTEKIQTGIVSAATIYNYNDQNRLTTTISSGGAETRYFYDENGNLLSKTIGKIETVSAEELTAKDLPDLGLIIKRDNENGTGTQDITYYKYDNYNRLIKMKADNTTATYRYNAQGYRVEKTVNNETTEYLYEGDKVVLETDKNKIQKAFQVYGSNLLYRAVAADTVMGAREYYYLYNAHGDVTGLIDAIGNIVVTYDYDAFGNILSKTGEANNSIVYAGYQHDEESGLYYLNARYYDSVTARFISEDTYRGKPNDPQSLNLYTYCSNSPIMYSDPTGHWTSAVHVTDTKVVARNEFSTYLEDQVDDKVVYQTNKDGSYKTKNGYKIIDEKKSDKKAATWLKDQRKQADIYVNALTLEISMLIKKILFSNEQVLQVIVSFMEEKILILMIAKMTLNLLLVKGKVLLQLS